MRAAERIFTHIEGANNNKKEESMFALGQVITGEPNVTIQIHGSSKALPSAFFVMPYTKFKKGETVLVQRIVGTRPTDRQYVVKPLHDMVSVCKYTGSDYVLLADSSIKYPASQTFCPWPIPAGMNVLLLPNRFPTKDAIWVVVNAYV
ncbi:hypothetical protein [Bacillus wiedmannii]|uniref:hypothetical protein n=1 Tax=Bacillus wiedmannii TaxID=1890302 RepID=UPI000BEFE55A|nr:hypothetical protein [Bacillus wiedmannii]PEL81155.1 hypothetical protein CN609_13845 [Bacillus wiedmannii]